MVTRPVLVAACLAAFVHAVSAADSTNAEWTKLQSLLRECTAVATSPLPAPECCLLASAPLLGNGEVGVVVGGDEQRLSFNFGRADFRRRAIGGLDILVDGTGSADDAARHEQDIERAEMRSQVALNGLPLEVTTWLTPEQPLVICELHNPSDKPLPVRVSTWSRPPLNLRNPIRLFDAGIKDLVDGLYDDQGRVAYGAAPAEGADLWRFVQVENLWRVQNEVTDRYLAITPKGKVETRAEADRATGVRHENHWFHGLSHLAVGGWYLGMRRDADGKSVPVGQRNRPRYGIGMEYAAHRFFPGSAGHLDGDAWAWRSYSDNGMNANAVEITRVLGVKAELKDATHSFVLPPRGTATVAIAVTGDINLPARVKSLEQCGAEGLKLVDALTPEKVQTLSEQRVADWKAYWLKAWLDTGDPLLNRYWYGSFYMLRCTSRPGQQSPSLFGVWGTADCPVLMNREFNNYNYESQMYGVFTGNRPELATPQFDDILKLLPWAKGQAARAGYRGAMWPRTIHAHPNGPPPTAFPDPKVAGKKNRGALGNDQLDAPAFLAMNFLDAYETTLDRDFLEKKAYPMVRACVKFYEDYLYLNKEKNRYELHRSAAREGTNDNNPAYPLAFIKRIATAAVNYSEVLGVDADRCAKWRDIAARMSEYPTTTINGKTMFRETESNPRVLLRGPGDNVSLLQIIHPGAGIGLDSDPKLLEFAHNTLAYANSNPDKPSWLQTPNNPAVIFVQAATVGWDAKDLYYWFHRYLTREERPNLTWQTWGIEGAIATEAIHRMMFQSHLASASGQAGVLRFFPVWPRDKDAQFTRLRAHGAFLVSAELKNGMVTGVQIVSEKGRDCTVLNPWPGKKVQLAGRETLGGDRFTFNTKPGEVIEIKPQG